MRIVVMGSLGFIGRRVREHLETAGHSVAGYDVKDPWWLDRPDGPVEDVLCNLAAVGDVYECGDDPVRAAEANVVLAARAAQACQESRVHLVHASTWEVTDPTTVYAATKLAGEVCVRAACPGATILRLGSAYGPNMRPSTVIRRFLDAARAGKPLTVHGDGTQFRQWTHTADIARAFELACDQRPAITCNVVSEEQTTILELAETIAQRYGVPIEHVGERSHDVTSEAVPNTAVDPLGWRAHRTFADGLAELLED